MSESEWTPIFPLPMVACPGESVPLHIFEPRYKEMIAHCREQETRGRPGVFVLVYGAGDRLASIGCAMRIAKVLKTYEDGRLDLVTAGQYRCRLIEVETGESYATARIERVSDGAEDWDEALANRVFAAHRRLVSLVTGKEPPASEYAGRRALSFYVLPTAGLPTAEKQRIFEMPRENERLSALADHLQALTATLIASHEAIQSIQQALQASRLLRG